MLTAGGNTEYILLRKEVVAPIVDTGGGEHNEAELAALVGIHPVYIERFYVVFDHIDRLVAIDVVFCNRVGERL